MMCIIKEDKIFYVISDFELINLITLAKQGLFEGTKAYKREDGRIFLFRPKDSAIRMQIGAERMCMISPSVDQFVDAVKKTALANKRWVIILINLINHII